MTKKKAIVLIALIVSMALATAVYARTSPPVINIKDANGYATVRCINEHVDEMIITPISDKEVIIMCRVYFLDDE